MFNRLESADSFAKVTDHQVFSTVMFVRFFLFLVLAVVAAAMPGGWSNADVTSPEVLEAANFAIDHKFSDSHPAFKITQARKQV